MKRSYIGTVLEEKTVQYNGLDYLTILKNFQYDHAERLLSICHRITETASMKTREEVPHLLNWLTYDGLGRLQRKSMGKMPAKYLKKNPNYEFAETQYYDYNIRNWLNSSEAYRLMDKNNYTSTSKGGSEKLNFSMELKYHNPNNFLKTQWNGNISQYTWNGGGYNLEYDGISRLISARGSLGAYFEEQIEYDNGSAGNGNITKLKRWTKAGTGYTSIDDLTYNYANGTKSNQLMSVGDASGQSAGYNNTSTSGDDFEYDKNGNLTKDRDKSIKTIKYNVLNLVGTVEGETTIGTGDLKNITQTYVWDAAGSKLKYKSGAGIEKIYIGATEYANNTNNIIAPSRIATEEGHVALRTGWTENSPLTKYVYYYTVKDHLGSVRIVIDDDQDAEVHQRNNYSAFGMMEFGTEGQIPANAKKFNDRFYNGKEQQDVVGWYDFGARMYNAELGRWMTIDPLAEKYYSINPYGFVFNNPIILIDPDGKYVDVSSIYEKNKDGEYKNPELVKAFNNFASSKQGIAFLSKFADKGQIIGGHKYTKNGSNHEINLSYKTSDLKDKYGNESNSNGRTDASGSNGKGKIDILINNNSQDKKDFTANGITQNMFIWNLTKTLLHESLVHAIYDAGDISDGSIDKSNMPMVTTSYGITKRQTQHEFYRTNTSSHPYYTQGSELLQKLNKQYGLFKEDSKKQIFNRMWSFTD
jgi:RHS repeat-associated protein